MLVKLFSGLLGVVIALGLGLLFLDWYADPTNFNKPVEYNKTIALYTEAQNDYGLCIWYKDATSDGEYLIINDYYTGKDWLLGNYKYCDNSVKVLKSKHIPNSATRNFEYIKENK